MITYIWNVNHNQDWNEKSTYLHYFECKTQIIIRTKYIKGILAILVRNENLRND